MALDYTKLDLPNASGSTFNLTSEQTEHERLYKLKPRTQSGNIIFTSATSGIVYNTLTSESGLYANQGEQGMLNILRIKLRSYLMAAEDYNRLAIYKFGTGTFPSGGLTYTLVDSFIDLGTQIIISPTSEKAGEWSVESGDGQFTITSTETEVLNVTFDWGATRKTTVEAVILF